MTVTSRRAARQSGMVNIMLLFVLSLVVLVPAVGLAIDCTMMFVTKSRLQAAADAAALAAGRALTVNQPLDTQTTYAQNRATAFFNANFPNNFMLSSNASVTVDPPFYGTGVNARTLYTDVHGSADAPLFFMRYLVPNATTVRTFAESARRDINVIMVLDKSGSMSGVPCATMKQSAQNFVNYFSPGRDTLGLISFDGAYSVDYPPTQNFINANGGLQAAIGNISCNGNTGTAQALYQAYQLIQTINQPSALNVIVLFTDGQPNGVTADYPIRRANANDIRYGSGVSGEPLPNGCGDNATTTLCSYPKSTCTGNSATVRGYLAEWNGGPWATGVTAGIMNWISTEDTITSPGNCYYNNNGNQSARRDIAYIPPSDIYGNATSGYHTDYVAQSNGTGSFVTDSDKFPVGHRYRDTVANAWLRPDTPSSICNASINAADAQARTIRRNATYGTLIYAIGLGGNPGLPPDTELMIRMTNVQTGTDPIHNSVITNTAYDSTLPSGMYQYVSNPTQLNTAFAQLASSILRLNQ